jgi:hypothetical protein
LNQKEFDSEDFQSTEYTVDILLHDKTAELIASQISRILKNDIDNISIRSTTTIRANVKGGQLIEVAKLDQVRAIEEVVKLELYTSVARLILKIDDVGLTRNLVDLAQSQGKVKGKRHVPPRKAPALSFDKPPSQAKKPRGKPLKLKEQEDKALPQKEIGAIHARRF